MDRNDSMDGAAAPTGWYGKRIASSTYVRTVRNVLVEVEAVLYTSIEYRGTTLLLIARSSTIHKTVCK